MNAPTPFDVAPPADYPRRNVVYLRPHRMAQATQDRGMLAATDDIARRQRENLARFYRANPQFGPARAVEGGAPRRPPLWQVVVAVAFVYALLLAAMVLS